jgi:hypothetical protein
MSHNYRMQQYTMHYDTPQNGFDRLFSEEESGLGSRPELDDRQTTVKKINHILSVFSVLMLLSYKSFDQCNTNACILI